MFEFLKNIFGEKADIQELIRNGAIIVDVRTKAEFQNGHIKNSINIPLDKLPQNLKKLNKERTIITCCESGSRSGAARRILKSQGFENIHNGGSWRGLRKFL